MKRYIKPKFPDNIQKLTERISFSGFKDEGGYLKFVENKILLHICCAPCATYTVLKLKFYYGFEVLGFYFNPNIHPKKEYLKRLAEVKKLAKIFNFKIIEWEYEPRRWFLRTKTLSMEPEGGRRCNICYGIRLDKTGEIAKKLKIKFFSTTLSISPHMNVKIISKIGKRVAKKYGITFLDDVYRKSNGYLYSVRLSKELGFYRQNYCGCIYSYLERKRNL